MPTDARYQPDPKHVELGAAFFDAVEPARFPSHITRFRNQVWAEKIGLGGLTDAEWINHFGLFEPLPDNIKQPLALRYHGHQFRHYNPDLGDGRGFLFAQVRDPDGARRADPSTPPPPDNANRLLDLATKGSGQTPWSRDGDGRLTLKGGLREVLASELLEALGVYTSKSFSLIETGEKLHRGDEPSPTRSSVLVRLGHSHVRIGTFQRLAFHGDTDNLNRLIDYVIATYWPAADSEADRVAALFGHVVGAVANQAAEWFAAGFVHGVLNTDNIVITGESFDYGPWRFLPYFEPGLTAAYFDQSGLYAFARQPGALHWNLQRLADCLLPLTREDALVHALTGFGPKFEARLRAMTLARLGLEADGDYANADGAQSLIEGFYASLHKSRLPFAQAFHDLFAGAPAERLNTSAENATYQAKPWSRIVAQLRDAPPHPALAPALDGTDATSMGQRRAQPVTLLYDEVEAIWSAIAKSDDWQPFEDKVAQIRDFGRSMAPLYPKRPASITASIPG